MEKNSTNQVLSKMRQTNIAHTLRVRIIAQIVLMSMLFQLGFPTCS